MPTAGVRGNINAPSTTPEYWVGRYGNYQPHGHAGWDGKCPVGTEVRAMSGGTVLWADWGYNLPGAGAVRKWLFYATFPGKLLVIQHWWGIGAYAHLSAFRVKAGDAVTEGQVVALSGDTGGVDPHLHVEALVDLSYRTGGGLIYGRTDPAKYFGTINPSGDVNEEDLVATPQERAELVKDLLDTQVDQVGGGKITLRDMLAEYRPHVTQVVDTVGQVPGAVLNAKVVRGGIMGGETSLGGLVAWNDDHVLQTLSAIAATAAAGGASVEEIKDAVKAGLEEGVHVDVKVSTNGVTQ